MNSESDLTNITSSGTLNTEDQKTDRPLANLLNSNQGEPLDEMNNLLVIPTKKPIELPPIRKSILSKPLEKPKLKLFHTKSVRQIAPVSKESSASSNKRNTERLDIKKRSGSIFFRRKEVKDPLLEETHRLPTIFENKRMSANIFSVLTKVKGAISTLKGRAGIGVVRTLKPNQRTIINDWAWFADDKEKEEDNEDKDYYIVGKVKYFGRRLYRFLSDNIVNSRIWNLTNEALAKIKPISPEKKMKYVWDLFMMAVVFWYFVVISIGICFDQPFIEVYIFTSKQLASRGYPVFICFCFIFLIIDMVVAASTGFYEVGELILNKRRILKKYLREKFYKDFLSLLAIFFQLIHLGGDLQSEFVRYIQLLFVLKLTNLSNIYQTLIDFLALDEFYESIFALLYLAFKTLFLAHIVACLWYSIGNRNINYPRNWLMAKDLLGYEWREHYIFSLYFSLTTMCTVGYGDISPQNEVEACFCSVIMIVGSVLFGYSISSIGEILKKINKSNNIFREEIREVNRYMRKKQLDYDVQVRVRKYLEFVWREDHNTNAEKDEEMLKKLSSSLREEVLLQSHGRILQKLPVLSHNFSEKTIRQLLSCLKAVRYTPEEIIYEEDQAIEPKLYFISQGEVSLSLFATRRGEKPLVIRTLKENSSFGEIPFFINMPYTHTARSVGFSVIYQINQEDFMKVINQTPEDYERFCQIRDEIFIYGKHDRALSCCFSCEETNHLLERCPVLNYIPRKDFIAQKSQSSQFQKRNKLYKKRHHDRNKNVLINLKNMQNAVYRYMGQTGRGKLVMQDSSEESSSDESMASETPEMTLTKGASKLTVQAPHEDSYSRTPVKSPAASSPMKFGSKSSGPGSFFASGKEDTEEGYQIDNMNVAQNLVKTEGREKLQHQSLLQGKQEEFLGGGVIPPGALYRRVSKQIYINKSSVQSQRDSSFFLMEQRNLLERNTVSGPISINNYDEGAHPKGAKKSIVNLEPIIKEKQHSNEKNDKLKEELELDLDLFDMDVDVWKNWDYYFPHNNPDLVLASQILSPKKMRKKLLTNKLFKKKSQHFKPQINSAPVIFMNRLAKKV